MEMVKTTLTMKKYEEIIRRKVIFSYTRVILFFVLVVYIFFHFFFLIPVHVGWSVEFFFTIINETL